MNKKNIERIATERIEILIDNALREIHNDEKLSQSYAKLARKIAMRVRIRMPYWMRQLFCRKCKQFIVPGINSRMRIGRTKVKSIRITCMKCNHVYRKIIEINAIILSSVLVDMKYIRIILCFSLLMLKN